MISQQSRKSNRGKNQSDFKTSNGAKVLKKSKLWPVEKRESSNGQKNDTDLNDLSLSSGEMLSEAADRAMPVKSAMRPSSLGTVRLPTAAVNDLCNESLLCRRAFLASLISSSLCDHVIN